MTSTSSYTTEKKDLPWGHTLFPEIETLARKIKKGEIGSILKPLLTMEELGDYFKIEVELPGIKREDIFVYVNEHDLIIIIFHKNNSELRKKLQIDEFVNDFLSEDILLPDTADTEVVCAELNDGILHLSIPKNPTAPKALFSQIGVY